MSELAFEVVRREEMMLVVECKPESGDLFASEVAGCPAIDERIRLLVENGGRRYGVKLPAADLSQKNRGPTEFRFER